MPESIEVNGVRLAYDTYGGAAAPAMVLLHGGGADRSTWSRVGPALGAGHRVYAPDLRGFGDSARPGAYSFELMRDDVVGFVEALGLRDVTLVGHSMGGTVAWLVAMRRPDLLRRLVVEDTPPPRAGGAPRPVPARPADPPPFDWDALEAVLRQLNDPDPRWWRAAASIPLPVLVLAGGPASHVPQQELAEVAAWVPDGRLVTIPAGHGIHLARPDEFVAAVAAEPPAVAAEPPAVAAEPPAVAAEPPGGAMP
jgi:3-oxoadipate enol-lactonase